MRSVTATFAKQAVRIGCRAKDIVSWQAGTVLLPVFPSVGEGGHIRQKKNYATFRNSTSYGLADPP